MANAKEVLAAVRKMRGLPPPKEPTGSLGMPEGIDFSPLWEEPKDPNSMVLILSGINTAFIVITLLVAIFKHG